MEKTFLKLDKEMAIMILSGFVMLFAFLNNYNFTSNIISFILIFIKSLIFGVIPFLFYLLEKECIELKKVAGIYTSYFIINIFVVLIMFVLNGIVPKIFNTTFDLINLLILLSSLFILIEQFFCYNGIKSKIYSNTIMKVVYIIGETISYPFLLFINKKINRRDKEV